MNNKIKRFFAILGAVLLSLLMVLFSVFYVSSFSSSVASADLFDNPPTSSENTSYISVTGSDVTNVISQNQIYVEVSSNNSVSAGYLTFNVSPYLPGEANELSFFNFNFVYTGVNTGDKNPSFGVQLLNYFGDIIGSYWFGSSTYRVLDLSLSDFFVNGSSVGNYLLGFYSFRIVIKQNLSSSGASSYLGTWFQLLKYDLSFGNNGSDGNDPYSVDLSYTSYIYDLLNDSSVPAYQNGYNTGYSEGKDVGISSQFANPLTLFTEPVDAFFNINIFGNFSIGDIFSVILFVLIALMFIKMFAGG